MAAKIEKPRSGAKLNSIARIVEQLVDAVNALQNITLSPVSVGKVQYADGNVVIVFNTEKCGA